MNVETIHKEFCHKCPKFETTDRGATSGRIINWWCYADDRPDKAIGYYIASICPSYTKPQFNESFQVPLACPYRLEMILQGHL